MSPATELTSIPVSRPAPIDAREGALLGTLRMSGGAFRAWTAFLAAIILWGGFAYSLQWRHGLIETGMRDQISWGLYISNFVFFIGISHAGTLISAILRVTDAGWRRPITRMAEGITVVALCIGGSMVLIDLGRPDRALNLFRYGRIQSPIVWDVLSVSTYLTGCLLYFYLPLIPDLALVAKAGSLGSLRRRVFRFLSLGWTGSPGEWHLLERAISIMAVAIIPLAISVHTVVSWIFAMTLRPGWDSSIFGPYFVVGAIYSGAAAVVLAMCILRSVLKLEDYLQPVHYRNLGLLLFSFSLLYLYFNVNEYLTVGYKFQGGEKLLLERLFFGDYAPFFWTVQIIGVILPVLLMMAVLGPRRYRQFTVPGLGLASFLAIAGAWAKRYLIVVPTLSSPFLPIQRVPEQWAHYSPTWVEWSITAAAFAAFLLLYTLLIKWFPVVSVWETRPEEPVSTAPPESAAAGFGPPGWGPAVSSSGIVVALVLAGAVAVRGQSAAHEHHHAAEPPATATAASATVSESASGPQPSLTITWKALAPVEEARIEDARTRPAPSAPAHVLASSRPFPLPWSPPVGQRPDSGLVFPAIQIAAQLRDPQGAAIAFRPVAFALKTLFGSIDYGSRPTDDEGKVELVIRDRRLGAYPLIATYTGDGRVVRSQALINFGVRPEPALPSVGVLVSPGFSPEIGLPFLCFYGGMWCVFAYCVGYLVIYRLGKVRKGLPAVTQILQPQVMGPETAPLASEAINSAHRS